MHSIETRGSESQERGPDSPGRRRFLLSLWPAGVGVVGVASTQLAIEKVIENPSGHEITPEVSERLQELSRVIAPKIEFYPGRPPLHNDYPYKVELDKQEVALAMAQLAYLNGGMEDAKKVADFFERQQLHIKFGKSLVSFGRVAGAYTDIPVDNGPWKIVMREDLRNPYRYQSELHATVVAEDELIHELGHVIEAIKDPNWRLKYQVGGVIEPVSWAMPITGVLASAYENLLTWADVEMDRNKFISLCRTFIVVAIASIVVDKVGNILTFGKWGSENVEERRVDKQSDRFLKDRSLYPDLGQFFTFSRAVDK